MNCATTGTIRGTAILMALLGIYRMAECKERVGAEPSTAAPAALLAGRYDNAAQVARGKADGEEPPPQRVTISVEPTPRAGWQLWRVHMDVDPDVAQSAGSDTSLDAVWAMKFSRAPDGKGLEMIPYTTKPSVDSDALQASAFDPAQWLPLEACMLRGHFGKTRVAAQVPPDEMCVASTMNLGGKRAFLPNAIEADGDWLHAQLMYFGKPWRVDARRIAK